mgnify:CR=1 FL=1
MTTLLLNPMANLLNFEREFERIFRGAVAPGKTPRNAAMDQDADNLYVELSVPGTAPESIEVSVEDDELRITGNRPETPKAEDVVAWRLKERRAGAFSQRFRLPTGIDRDKVEAKYEHGILTVTIPKAAALKPKQIEVKVA